MKDAMDNRFELRRLKLAKDINSIDIAFFKNQTRPQIDLNTTFSLDGLSRGGASTARHNRAAIFRKRRVSSTKIEHATNNRPAIPARTL